MLISCSKIVLLCDDICLQYNRGFSCEEIVERCRSLLDNHELQLADIKALTQLSHSDAFADGLSFEICGVRMYDVLRRMATPQKAVLFQINKLILFALKSVETGVMRSLLTVNTTW